MSITFVWTIVLVIAIIVEAITVDLVSIWFGLGAIAALIGRPFVTASFGGKREGVKTYVDGLKGELKSAMVLTGCKNVSSISKRIIFDGK